MKRTKNDDDLPRRDEHASSIGAATASAVREGCGPTTIAVGDVVQIDPDHDPRFGACFLVVTEVKSWGVQGYVQVPGAGADGGEAYYRVPYERIHRIGHAEWLHECHEDDQ